MAGEIHGKVFSKIELYNDYSGEAWGIDLHYDFNRWFSIGVEAITFTDGFNGLGFIPNQQNYDVYLEIKSTQNITLKLSQWCYHPVIATPNKSYLFTTEDKEYLSGGICLNVEFLF